jgi:hypothetical protein
MIRRDTTGAEIESAGDAMRQIQSETFASLLSAEDEIRAHEHLFPHSISVPAWNAIQDRWNRAAEQVICDPELLAELRHIVPNVREPRDRRMLAQLLLVPLDELPPDQSAILADPRIGLTADQVQIAPAIYLVDVEPDPREASPYDSDAADPEEPFHDLTRMGGLPTLGPWERPETPFILQLDLSTLPQDNAIRAFISQTPLPQEGLLQLFHTTMGDSRTDPQRAGGGATVLYVPEKTLVHRARPHGNEVYSARRIRMRMLPSFRFGPAAHSDEVSLKVITLQMRADAIARSGTRFDEEGYVARTDPFEEIVPSSSRMLGIQWFDVDDSDETREILVRDLPLGTPNDRHILLLDVSSDTALEGIFGDDGRLEVWIRASDLAASDFSHVVSFIRSS